MSKSASICASESVSRTCVFFASIHFESARKDSSTHTLIHTYCTVYAQTSLIAGQRRKCMIDDWLFLSDSHTPARSKSTELTQSILYIIHSRSVAVVILWFISFLKLLLSALLLRTCISISIKHTYGKHVKVHRIERKKERG